METSRRRFVDQAKLEKSPLCVDKSNSTNMKPLSLYDLFGGFIIILLGTVAALIFLLMEKNRLSCLKMKNLVENMY